MREMQDLRQDADVQRRNGLLGYKEQFNPNEKVALFNLFNKVAILVGLLLPARAEGSRSEVSFGIFDVVFHGRNGAGRGVRL